MPDPISVRRGLPAAGSAGGGAAGASDRRFRRSTVKPGKRRTWQIALRRIALFGAAIVVVLGLCAWGVLTFTHASMFVIDRVVVQGNHKLSSGEVRALLD